MSVHGVSHDTPWFDELPISRDARMAMTDWDKETTFIDWDQVSTVPILQCTVVLMSLYCGHQFCHVDTRYRSVIFPLIISSPCVARHVVVRCKSGSTEHQRSCNRRELISTGRQTYEVRIKRMSSAQPVGTFSVRRPFQLLYMFKTCHRIDPTSPDEERISPHVTRRQAYKQRMRTDTTRSKIGVYVSRSVWCYPARCDTPLSMVVTGFFAQCHAT